mgnify:CR=1 FL=1
MKLETTNHSFCWWILTIILISLTCLHILCPHHKVPIYFSSETFQIFSFYIKNTSWNFVHAHLQCWQCREKENESEDEDEEDPSHVVLDCGPWLEQSPGIPIDEPITRCTENFTHYYQQYSSHITADREELYAVFIYVVQYIQGGMRGKLGRSVIPVFASPSDCHLIVKEHDHEHRQEDPCYYQYSYRHYYYYTRQHHLRLHHRWGTWGDEEWRKREEALLRLFFQIVYWAMDSSAA